MSENSQTLDRDKSSNFFLSHYSIPENILAQELDGEIVLLNMNNETYFSLNTTGSLMWKLLTEHQGVETIRQSLQAYAVDSAVSLRDITTLANELLQEGLLQEAQ